MQNSRCEESGNRARESLFAGRGRLVVEFWREKLGNREWKKKKSKERRVDEEVEEIVRTEGSIVNRRH